MKLSEAIRQGAAIRPQAYRDYCTRLPDGGYATCALGAAYEALTGQLPPSAYGPVDHVDLFLRGKYGEAYSIRRDAIVECNDEDRLSREEIAAQLEARGL